VAGCATLARFAGHAPTSGETNLELIETARVQLKGPQPRRAENPPYVAAHFKSTRAGSITLAFLEPPRLPITPWDQLDAEARAAALEILARLIAQALETSRQTEAADD
jgi:hypothetical protein